MTRAHYCRYKGKKQKIKYAAKTSTKTSSTPPESPQCGDQPVQHPLLPVSRFAENYPLRRCFFQQASTRRVYMQTNPTQNAQGSRCAKEYRVKNVSVSSEVYAWKTNCFDKFIALETSTDTDIVEQVRMRVRRT